MKPLVIIISEKQTEIDLILKLLGQKYDTMCVKSSSEALDFYKSIYNTVRIVLIDLSLEGLKGLELLQKLKEISSKPEIIVFSDSKDPKTVIDSMKLGAFSFIPLPVSKSKLLNTLTQAINSDNTITRMEKETKKVYLEKFEQKINQINNYISAKNQNGNSVSDEEIKTLLNKENLGVDLTEKERTSLFDLQKEEESRKPSILIVEDDDGLRPLLFKMLVLNNVVKVSENGQKALDILRKTPSIDMILLDIGLPDCNGVELIPKIKEINEEIEIVLLTAYKDYDYIINSFREDAFEYITKPFEKDFVFEAISRAIRRKYFKKSFQDTCKILSDYPFNKKINILNDIAKQRTEEEKRMLMKEVYLFFPELKESGIPETSFVNKKYLQDGILYLVEDLKTEIKKNHKSATK